MKGHINLGHIQKFLCHEECLKCDVAKRIWLEGKASLHWNLENNKRPFLSHVIDPNIKYGSITCGEKFYDAETIDTAKEVPKPQQSFDSYDYNAGLEKIIFYNHEEKNRNYRYFGNKLDLSRQILKSRVKKRKTDSSIFSAPPSILWSKNTIEKVFFDKSCRDASTVRGLKCCGERLKPIEKPIKQEATLKEVLEQALKSLESKVEEPKAPSKLISREGVNFKGFHPAADHNELFKKAFGKLPVFDTKPKTETNVVIPPIPITPLTPTESTLPTTPNVGMSIPNSPIGGQVFLPFSPTQQQAQQPVAGVNPFAVQFPSGRRRFRGRR